MRQIWALLLTLAPNCLHI